MSTDTSQDQPSAVFKATTFGALLAPDMGMGMAIFLAALHARYCGTVREAREGAGVHCAAPTVSAIVAPRAPSGFSVPTVVSRAV
jgi:hypothetical protein